MAKRRRLNNGGFLRNFGRAAGGIYKGYRTYTNLRNAFRGNGSHTRTRNQRQSSGRGVTFQRDVSTIYRRKPMPRRKKKRYLRQNRRIQHVIDKSLNTRIILRNGNQTISGTGQNSQIYGEYWLYGLNGAPSVATGTDDVDVLFNNEFPAVPTIPTFPQPPNAQKIRFEVAVLDLTFCNTSLPSLDDGTVPRLEVDVYEMLGLSAANSYGTAFSLYTDMAVQSQTIKAATGLTLSNRGTTPFTWPAAAKYLRILKKTKYFLSALQTFTYQIRDPKNRSLDGNLISSNGNDSFIWPYATRGLWVVVKPVVGTVGLAGQFALTVGRTAQYNYVVPDIYPMADGGGL